MFRAFERCRSWYLSVPDAHQSGPGQTRSPKKSHLLSAAFLIPRALTLTTCQQISLRQLPILPVENLMSRVCHKEFLPNNKKEDSGGGILAGPSLQWFFGGLFFVNGTG
jgi:hypothetical protein